MMKLIVLSFAALGLAAVLPSRFFKSETPPLAAVSAPENPVELGRVAWLRDFAAAKVEAQKTQKPLLMLFQEVPGCVVCSRYGAQALSHPLLVEAIETQFVPVCIFNNKGGKDRETLERFGEPAWNNPVVRILDHETEKDLVERISNDRSPHGLAQGIVAALKKTGKTPPVWLKNLENELEIEQRGADEAVFSMFCFWTGEARLGAIEGVAATEPGFMDGREAVKVAYDPDVISYEELLQKAARSGCADKVFCKNEAQKNAAAEIVGQDRTASIKGFRPDREPKYHLAQTAWRFVPMTPMQAVRANALVAEGRSPEGILSARQVALKKAIDESPRKKWRSALDAVDLTKVWAEAETIRDGS